MNEGNCTFPLALSGGHMATCLPFCQYPSVASVPVDKDMRLCALH